MGSASASLVYAWLAYSMVKMVNIQQGRVVALSGGDQEIEPEDTSAAHPRTESGDRSMLKTESCQRG
jgi:hypothetical protein